jgi:hypothetical protein
MFFFLRRDPKDEAKRANKNDATEDETIKAKKDDTQKANE